MKIGIFGSYNRLNFGDDLLAYYISEVLSHQHEVIVYTSQDQLKLASSVTKTNSRTTFISQSDVLVLGGGGFLTSTSDELLEVELVELLASAQAKCLPLYIISIGGDQKPENDVWDYLGDGRKALFSYPYLQKCVVRTTEEFGKHDSRFAFEEDVLWGCLEPENIMQGNLQKYNIGIHLSSLPILRVVTGIAEIISLLLFKRVQFTYFKTHDSKINGIDEMGSFLPFGSEVIQHNGDVLSFIQALQRVDILISAKMHIGLLCLSIGKPFISFGGPIKAQNLLKKLHLDSFILPSSPRMLTYFLIRHILFKKDRVHIIPMDEICKMKELSRNNFRFIKE